LGKASGHEYPEPLVGGLLVRPEHGDVIGAGLISGDDTEQPSEGETEMSLVEDKPWESTGVNGEVNYTDLKDRACSSGPHWL